MVSASNVCNNFCKCHIINFCLLKIYIFLFFVSFLSFAFLKNQVVFWMINETMFQVERHTEIFLLINLSYTILGQDFRVQFIDCVNKIKFHSLQHCYCANVAYKVHFYAYQGYIRMWLEGPVTQLRFLTSK